jgi:N-acetylglucosaminyldiphosphoundecaprenol N-acetyl-beta-D-mannosaminyltransferase
MKKTALGKIHAHPLTFEQALCVIDDALEKKKGGYVVTPNVDHVCLAENNTLLREAYTHALISLVDGMPLLWLSKWLGDPLPEKISGSDLVDPLMALCARKKYTVYVLGGGEGVAEAASRVWMKRYPGLNVVGTYAPPYGFEKNPSMVRDVNERIQRAQPDVLLVALGCPKQEIWMMQNRQAWEHTLAFGIGAAVDFAAGTAKRCPGWVSSLGCEWLFRLFQEPKRLAHRYLVRDRAIVAVAWRMWRAQRTPLFLK